MVGFWSQGAEPRSFEEQGQGPMRSMPRATDGAPEWAKRLEQGAGQGAAEGGWAEDGAEVGSARWSLGADRASYGLPCPSWRRRW